MTFRTRTPPIGSRPGTLAIPADAPEPRIRVFAYDADGCTQLSTDEPGELRTHMESDRTTWIDVQGFGNEAKLWEIADLCGLDGLTLEDATNVPQRAKSDLLSRYQLMVARVPRPGEDGAIAVPQVCLILSDKWLLTFQDRHFGFFDPVRDRIREGIGPIRTLGPGYLAYALLDLLVDRYFPIVGQLAEELEDLEDRVNEDPDPATLAALHQVRRKLVVIRRIGWPQREAFRTMLVEHGPFLTPEVKVFLRSTEQHMAQVMEAVDSAKEVSSGLVEIYLSNVSQKTNEIMKVLTLMASIFIPLTFVAGIYGMNFEAMPELHSAWGYPIVLGIMGAVAAGMLLYFRRKGWLGSRKHK